MKRIVEYKLANKMYPLNFSTKAAKELAERYGGLENMDKIFETEKTAKIIDEAIFILHILIDQGMKYEKIVSNKEYIPITIEDLEILIGVSELAEMKSAIMDAMIAGMKREIQTETDPNEKTTQDK